MYKLSKAIVRSGVVVLVLLVTFVASSFAPVSVLAAATTPALGAAGSFSVLAALSMSAAGAGTTINSDLGLSPGLAVSRTGLWNEGVGTHEYFGPLSLAAVAQSDALSAFNNLAGQSSSGTWSASVWSPPPGVWTVASDTTFSGTINLNGSSSDVWVFQVGRDMTFGGSVVLQGTSQACHVFWQIGRDATIQSGSAFVGTLIASRDISLVSGATVNGRIISLYGALTTDGNTITTGPVCASTPHLSFTKVVSPATYNNISDVLHYTLVATNDGNTNLTGVSISDVPGLTNIVSSLLQPAALAPGAALTVTGDHTISSADVSAGFFNNTATASVVGAPVPAPVSVTTYKQQSNAHLSLTKTASPTTYSQVGDIITYTLVATNDGNTSLTDVSISDPLLPNIVPALPVTLALGAKLTVIGTHTITTGDLTSGSVSNTATASSTSPVVSATASQQTFRAASVGGEVGTIDKMSVLAPWLGLGLVLVLGGIVLTVLLLRRRTSR